MVVMLLLVMTVAKSFEFLIHWSINWLIEWFIDEWMDGRVDGQSSSPPPPSIIIIIIIIHHQTNIIASTGQDKMTELNYSFGPHFELTTGFSKIGTSCFLMIVLLVILNPTLPVIAPKLQLQTHRFAKQPCPVCDQSGHSLNLIPYAIQRQSTLGVSGIACMLYASLFLIIDHHLWCHKEVGPTWACGYLGCLIR